MLNKQIPTLIGIIIILLLAGAVVAAVFLLRDVDEVIINEKKDLIEEKRDLIEKEENLSFEVFIAGLREDIGRYCSEVEVMEWELKEKYAGFPWIDEDNKVNLVKGYSFYANWKTNEDMKEKCGDKVTSYIEEKLVLNEKNTEEHPEIYGYGLRGFEKNEIKCVVLISNTYSEFEFECGDITKSTTPQEYGGIYISQNPNLKPSVGVFIYDVIDNFASGGMGSRKGPQIAVLFKKENDEWKSISATQDFFTCEMIFNENISPLLLESFHGCWSVENNEQWEYNEDLERWEEYKTGIPRFKSNDFHP